MDCLTIGLLEVGDRAERGLACQVTPGVWFGYSWWRGFFQTTLLLTFALTEQ